MKSEEQVYEAVMIGIRHNLDERKADLIAEIGAWELGDPMTIPRATAGLGVIKMLM